MKFRCERDTLAEAVATAQRTVASRSGALPVLQDLRITATERRPRARRLRPRDHEPGAGAGRGRGGRASRSSRSCSARSCASSSPARSPSTVTGDEAVIAAGRFTTSLRLKPAEDYPRLAPTDGEGVTVDAAAFAAALRQVVRAASKDDLRPILTGVLLTAHGGGLRLVATDSYRLAVRDLEGVSMLAGGPEGARRGEGPGRGAAPRRRRRDRGRAARARRRVPHVARRGHRAAHRG